MKNFVNVIENIVFKNRVIFLCLFVICTVFLGWKASQIKMDAGFAKNLPLKHEYMQTFIKYQAQFGGANRLMIAIHNKNGDIFNPEFFEIINKVTNELFFLPGVDRGLVSSIFTPNVRYTEVVEDGFVGAPVIPSDFVNDAKGIEMVRKNIIKAGIVGRLVSNDFTCVMITAQLLDFDPLTKKQLDYIKFAERLETEIRDKYQTDDIGIHIVGFAKVVGDVANAIKGVLLFFLIAIVITFFLVFIYSHSLKLTIVPILCSFIAVIWQLGILTLLGYGLDPMSILVPFLIFAIGVSHGMQMINAMGNQILAGAKSEAAARASFRQLLIPGAIALLSDTVGFLTLLLIEIGVIQELAITASIGVAVIILTNLILIPLIMSYLKFADNYDKKMGTAFQDKLWGTFASFADRKVGKYIVGVACVLFVVGLYFAKDMKIGDLHAGAAALHENSRYNKDTALITSKFSIGTDIISVIVEAPENGCLDYDTMEIIDQFEWYVSNVKGVKMAIGLPGTTKFVSAGFNEGNIKWRVLSRKSDILAEMTQQINTDTGLVNKDCSVMPVMIFTEDHKAETIERVVNAIKEFRDNNPSDKVKFRLASGQVGVMAATNESVKAAQIPMLIWVYLAVIGLCLVTFRSVRATLCVMLPLVLVSTLAQALMTFLKIGLTVNTLPVVALGVGIGVDYGIYIISPLRNFLKEGLSIKDAYLKTLKTTGSAVMFTGFTLAIGVSTWIFSALKFQMDIGILLSFMFLLNMFGAIILLPSLVAFFWKKDPEY
ncbi:MAG: MMPL family transporter [Proteobacteria bacterium]|nr:MMPL family transporter [Pseudomonadota bacterium]